MSKTTQVFIIFVTVNNKKNNKIKIAASAIPIHPAVRSLLQRQHSRLSALHLGFETPHRTQRSQSSNGMAALWTDYF